MQNKEQYKAYIVKPKNEFYSGVVFALTPGEAKSIALLLDGFEDTEFIDVRVYRLPKADSMRKGRYYMDWDNDEDRLFLVKECGFSCGSEYFYIDFCKSCCAKEFCGDYKEHLQYAESEEIDYV